MIRRNGFMMTVTGAKRRALAVSSKKLITDCSKDFRDRHLNDLNGLNVLN